VGCPYSRITWHEGNIHELVAGGCPNDPNGSPKGHLFGDYAYSFGSARCNVVIFDGAQPKLARPKGFAHDHNM
jgi:hypothetical protein